MDQRPGPRRGGNGNDGEGTENFQNREPKDNDASAETREECFDNCREAPDGKLICEMRTKASTMNPPRDPEELLFAKFDSRNSRKEPAQASGTTGDDNCDDTLQVDSQANFYEIYGENLAFDTFNLRGFDKPSCDKILNIRLKEEQKKHDDKGDNKGQQNGYKDWYGN